MNVAETIEEVRSMVADARKSGARVGLVPTMGALHEGHLSLIDAAAECDCVVVSIFVNPTQFGPGEDLEGYPREPDTDLAACEDHGADLVFMPQTDVMYGRSAKTEVSVGQLATTLCGRSRPTHFAGVCTVVAKLLNIVQPDRAYFGAKDFQQVVIIRRMVEDLDFPVEIVRCPTVREPDGLALSSRNEYLSPEERAQAPALARSLQLAERRIRDSAPSADEVTGLIREHLADAAPTGRIDYVQIVDPETLADVEQTTPPVLVALAVGFGRARLIDNVLVDVRESKV